MADDMTEAETAMAALQGAENHPYGVVLIRVVRQLRAARDRIAALEARVHALDGK